MQKIASITLLLLGCLAVVGGPLFLILALVLLLTGEANIAGIFVVPGLAVTYAGIWLLQYRKAKQASTKAL